jgi:hypothetical protein
MKNKLKDYIRKNPGLRAKVISKELNLVQPEVSKFLHDSNEFEQKDFSWYLINQFDLLIELPNKWLHYNYFENFLVDTGCLFTSQEKSICIVFPKKCQLMLIIGARLLFLINSLDLSGKEISLDFSKNKKLDGYLDRAGFFDALNTSVQVFPERTGISKAKIYKGNTDALVEFALIEPDKDTYDDAIPNALTRSLVSNLSEKFDGAAYNLFAELCQNIVEHSNSPIPGIAAFQNYANAKPPHLQVVISDLGDGIANTLRPALKDKSELDFDLDTISDFELIARAFTEAGLSQKNIECDDIGGQGLFASGLAMKKHNTTFFIRQETSQCRLVYENDKFVVTSEKLNLAKLPGTHICFQFNVD